MQILVICILLSLLYTPLQSHTTVDCSKVLLLSFIELYDAMLQCVVKHQNMIIIVIIIIVYIYIYIFLFTYLFVYLCVQYNMM